MGLHGIGENFSSIVGWVFFSDFVESSEANGFGSDWQNKIYIPHELYNFFLLFYFLCIERKRKKDGHKSSWKAWYFISW